MEYVTTVEDGQLTLYVKRPGAPDLFVDHFPSEEAIGEYKAEIEAFNGIGADFLKWACQWVGQKAEETGLARSYIRDAITRVV